MGTPTSVDEYLANVPELPRAALAELRQTIREAAPDATEDISYGMPAFRNAGRFRVSYAAYKNHCSLYPASEGVLRELADEVKPYFSGKGTIRFSAGSPLPASLVTKIVEMRLRETAPRAKR